MDKLVSVVIPSYNYGKFLKQAFDSVVNQTYANLEIIIVDDGSSDDTQEIVRPLVESFNNLRYIRHEANKGLPATRNTGINASNGEYIAILDADDEWLPEKIQKQVEFLNANPDIGMVSCGYLLKDTVKGIEREYLPADYGGHDDFLENLLVRNVFSGGSGALIRKECFMEAGLFDTSLRYCEDWDMWLRIARYFKISSLSEPLYVLYEHGYNMSHKIELMKDYRKKVISKNLPFFIENKLYQKSILNKAYSYCYLDTARGYNNLNLSKFKIFENCLIAIVCYPFKSDEKDNKYQLLLTAILPQSIFNHLRKFRNIFCR
ncbi:MAG: glycosyltransferase family 2 protein [Desulfobulbus sp.]